MYTDCVAGPAVQLSASTQSPCAASNQIGCSLLWSPLMALYACFFSNHLDHQRTTCCTSCLLLRCSQAWESHNRQQQQHHHLPSTLNAGRLVDHPAVPHQQQQQAATTAAALAKWGHVERTARSALKKASAHAVLALEMQALQLIEQVCV